MSGRLSAGSATPSEGAKDVGAAIADASCAHDGSGAMGKETSLVDLSSQQDWSAVDRLLKDSGTKISSKQINRVGRWAGRRLGSQHSLGRRHCCQLLGGSAAYPSPPSHNCRPRSAPAGMG